MARLNDVNASGYNSVGSERIWTWDTPSMLSGADPDRFWAQSAQKRERESKPKFCFLLSGKQRTTLPISGQPNFTKFAHNTWIYVAKNPF